MGLRDARSGRGDAKTRNRPALHSDRGAGRQAGTRRENSLGGVSGRAVRTILGRFHRRLLRRKDGGFHASTGSRSVRKRDFRGDQRRAISSRRSHLAFRREGARRLDRRRDSDFEPVRRRAGRFARRGYKRARRSGKRDRVRRFANLRENDGSGCFCRRKIGVQGRRGRRRAGRERDELLLLFQEQLPGLRPRKARAVATCEGRLSVRLVQHRHAGRERRRGEVRRFSSSGRDFGSDYAERKRPKREDLRNSTRQDAVFCGPRRVRARVYRAFRTLYLLPRRTCRAERQRLRVGRLRRRRRLGVVQNRRERERRLRDRRPRRTGTDGDSGATRRTAKDVGKRAEFARKRVENARFAAKDARKRAGNAKRRGTCRRKNGRNAVGRRRVAERKNGRRETCRQ